MHNKLNTQTWTTGDWISHLQLETHPEGGFYRRCFTSPVMIDTNRGERPSMTAIYYLLQGNGFSAWHRLASSEIWHFHAGAACRIYQLTASGVLSEQVLEPHKPLITIAPNTWFAAELVAPSPEAFMLASCTVSPGFDFADFELGDRETLVNLYPRHLDLVCRLTREAGGM